MSLTPRRTLGALAAILVVGTLVTGAEPAASTSRVASSGAEAARLLAYQPAEGDACYALALAPRAVPAAPGGLHLAVLVDTSASQMGEYRDRSIETLKQLLAQLSPDDRVLLTAVDLKSVPLTKGFVAPRSKAIDAALAQLDQREPLGTTDMAVVLGQLAADFSAGDDNAPRAAIYIGDGVSSAHVLEGQEFADLTAALAKRRVSVTSFAIGPQLDTHLLAALANQTGGMLTIDGTSVTPATAATALARAARTPVIWPTDVALPAALGNVVTQPLPPLRADRETILVGQGRISEPVEIKVAAEAAGKPIELAWHVEPVEPTNDNAFLARVVDMAKSDQGATLPTLGLAGLNELHRLVDLAADDLTRLGRQALATGNLDQAERLAQRSRELAPQNADADALGGAVNKLRTEEITPAQAAAPGDDLKLVRPRAAAPAGRNDGDALADESRMRRVRAELLEKQVSVAINDARATMSRDAVAAIEKLKTLKEHVRAAVDVDPEIRAQLDDQIGAALLTASRDATIQEEQAIHHQEILAAAEERRQINEQLYLREQKVTQSVERFNALIDEGRWGDALNVINYARELDPTALATHVAAESADLTQNTRDIHALVARRWVGALDTLASVERSHIPTPDEPPIVYPDAEWWQDMSQRRKEFATVDLAILKPKEKEIMKALDDDTTLDFVETPLTEVVQYLEDLHKIQIELDVAALDEAGAAPDTPITRNLSGISLRSALRLILSEHDLTYIIDNEVLMITTTEEAQNKLVTKVYPVADLVVPIQSMMGMGGMGMMGGMGGMGGMMGGMGGGMGGMGGGMGGMGMGGGMGGMGMGGGMGGMGMFNVPNRAGMLMWPNLLQNMPPGGFRPFQQFAVSDDLKLSRKPKTAPKPVAAKPAAKAAPAAGAQPAAPVESAKPQAINLTLREGQDVNQAWNDYFSQNKPSQADVRETARQLMKAQKFPDTIALLRAALRNGQSQPWMFEGLGLAMQAGGSSRDDIERALMSALDFSNRPVDFMSVAIYLARLGLDERALSLFRQASKLCPLEPEPYAYGLKVAQRMNDVNALEWAVCGVLSQAWSKEHEELWKSAHRAAMAMLEKLNADGRSAEAARLLEALDAAVVRDVVVEARWDGDADVDILIEEPTGSVCSLHQPRTTAGGVLLEDAFPQLNQDRSGGLREVYACPQGFDGKYKVLVRRMWGKPTAGKVTVDVYMHANAKSGMKHMRQTVPVGEGDAMVTFDLKQGRRTDPLNEQQLMTAAAEQLAVRRDLINQQLNAIADESSLRSLAADRQVQQQVAANGGAPFVRMPAAGFQPVIIVLPAGANLRATGVISADRRYVRFTGLPLFSGVSEVNTFNLFTGASGTSNAPSGGGFGGSGIGGLGGT
ncbi:MAG: hypothetical protein K2Y37_23590 [Pirellulales bacterium]|nr:hypothetical protein [Pirellulales bacterium]